MDFGFIKPLAIHGGVFLLMLGVSVLISILMPINISSQQVLIFVPPVFILYLGVFTIIQNWRRVSQKGKPK